VPFSIRRQTVTHGVGGGRNSRSSDGVYRGVRCSATPEMFRTASPGPRREGPSKVVQPPPRPFLTITSGALTAAVATMEPSNTTTEDAESVGAPATSFVPHAGLCRVSRRSTYDALTPHPRSCRPRHQGNNHVKFLVGVDVHDPHLHIRQQPPRRKRWSRLRSFDSISGSGSSPTAAAWAAMTTKRTMDRAAEGGRRPSCRPRSSNPRPSSRASNHTQTVVTPQPGVAASATSR